MRFGADPAPENGYVYVAQFYGSTVNEYSANNQHNDPPICEIRSRYLQDVQGIKTDHSGTLYAAGLFQNNTAVATFEPNCGAAGLMYPDRNGLADDVALNATTLYVSNRNDGHSYPAKIDVYTRGDPEATGQLAHPAVLVGVGVALDSHNNLFWSAAKQEFSYGFVVEFIDGRRPGIVLEASKIGADFPGGIIVDHANNLLVIDQNSKSINIYAPPYDAPAFSKIRLEGTALNCAMGIHERRLYCLDYQYGSVDIYAYPSGEYIHSFTNGINAMDNPTGIAVQTP